MENKKDKLKNLDLLENFGLQLDMGGKKWIKKKEKGKSNQGARDKSEKKKQS